MAPHRARFSCGRPRQWLALWTQWCMALLSCAVFLLPQQAQAGGGQALERRVKAAFLYKFLGYAEFPPGAFGDPGSPVVIAVAGSDEMAAELARIVAGRSVNQRPIVVRTLREHENAGPVHLLFAAGADCGRAGRAIRAAPRALLLVTECDDGLQQGSVINFRIIDERVRFDVSLDAAEKHSVRLSSRLLTVAHHVQKGGQ